MVEMPSEDSGMSDTEIAAPLVKPSRKPSPKSTAKGSVQKRQPKHKRDEEEATTNNAPKKIKRVAKRPAAAASNEDRAPRADRNALVRMRGSFDMPDYLAAHVREKMSARDSEPAVHDDFMELFSMPRVATEVRARNLRAIRSMDILNGWDLTKRDVQCNAFDEMIERKPAVTGMSPPCTMFSKIQEVNLPKMEATIAQERMAEAIHMLDVCIWAAKMLHDMGLGFYIEQPADARSWDRPEMQILMNTPGVTEAVFDQCMFGNVTKVEKTPVKKKTRLLTNVPQIRNIFHNVFCKNLHTHVSCQGEEGGEKRCKYAQVYPPPMVRALADGVEAYTRNTLKRYS